MQRFTFLAVNPTVHGVTVVTVVIGVAESANANYEAVGWHLIVCGRAYADRPADRCSSSFSTVDQFVTTNLI